MGLLRAGLDSFIANKKAKFHFFGEQEAAKELQILKMSQKFLP